MDRTGGDGHRHESVHDAGRARQGYGHLGRGRSGGWYRGRLPRRRDHGDQLALDLLRQRAGGTARAGRPPGARSPDGPSPRTPRHRGCATVTAALLLAVYAIVTANEYGWGSLETLGLLGMAAGLLWASSPSNPAVRSRSCASPSSEATTWLRRTSSWLSRRCVDPDVVLREPLSAAGSRARCVRIGRGTPADDGRDHGLDDRG